MAEISQGALILYSVLAFICILTLFIFIGVFSGKHRKGIESAIEERAKLEGKTIISNEEAKNDVVAMANSLAATVDALAEERERYTAIPESSPEKRSVRDNIMHLEASLQRGANLLNDTIKNSSEVSPAQLAQVKSIIASIAPDIKADNYSELKKLVSHTV